LISILHQLQNKCARRSKRDQCYFKIRHGRVVKIIEQVTDPKTGLQYAIVCCPQQRELYFSRFVVCTASIGIMHNSIKFQEQLARAHGDLLRGASPGQPIPPYQTELGASHPADASQLEAAILFHPPLSQRKVEAFERVGMGLENKVSVQRWRLDPAQRGHQRLWDCDSGLLTRALCLIWLTPIR